MFTTYNISTRITVYTACGIDEGYQYYAAKCKIIVLTQLIYYNYVLGDLMILSIALRHITADAS